MPNNILKGTGTKEINSPGSFKDNDNVPSWWTGSDLEVNGQKAEVVVTGSKGNIKGKKAGGYVSGPTRGSDPTSPIELEKGESITFSGKSKKTGNMRTTTYTPTEDTTRTRTSGRTYADRNKYYSTSTPVNITQTEIKPYKKK